MRGLGRHLWLAALLAAASVAPFARADGPATRPAENSASPTTKPVALTPHSVGDLHAIEDRVEEVVKKATPATVGIIAGMGQGSGVIVSKDGYVLTAGHVSANAGRDVMLILSDGRRVRGKTLGVNSGIDSGMIKITEGGDYPFVEMGKSSNLKTGQWVVALGHPGGYRKDRPPVVRLGRILIANDRVIGTDCTLVGGDSGGPLFDLDGKVVGIHSRIGASTLANMHVPVDTFTQTWDRLAKGDEWGDRVALSLRGPLLGVNGTTDEKGFKVTTVTPRSPADEAGVKVGDVIAQMNGRTVRGVQGLAEMIMARRPGDQVKLQILRGEETVDVTAKLIRRPE